MLMPMDIRDTAGVGRNNWVEDHDRMVVTVTDLRTKEWIDEKGEYCETQEDVEFPATYEVCSVCQGKGTYVNPNIDRYGLTGEDFAEDPEFHEDYVSGMYDVTCQQCKGRRVDMVIDYDRADPKDTELYDEYMEDFWRHQLELRSERMYGA